MPKCALLLCFLAARRCRRPLIPCRCCSCSFALPILTPLVQVMMQRLLSRAESSGRVDDNVESIRKRFR